MSEKLPEVSIAALCQHLAEQAYMNHLLTKRLIAAGILQTGELQRLYEENPQERTEFCLDFLRYLASTGQENQ